jgi:hypothetical protein
VQSAYGAADDEPMTVVADLVEAGSIVPVVDPTFPSSQFVEAIPLHGSRHRPRKDRRHGLMGC